MFRADDGGPVFRGKIRGNLPRDRARRFVPRPERAAERINHSALHLMDDGRRKVFKFERTGEFSEIMSERF